MGSEVTTSLFGLDKYLTDLYFFLSVLIHENIW